MQRISVYVYVYVYVYLQVLNINQNKAKKETPLQWGLRYSTDRDDDGFYAQLYLHCAKFLLMTSRARLSTLRGVLGLHCMHCSRREKNFVVARKLLRDQF